MFCYCSMSSATKAVSSFNLTEFRVFGLVLVSIALNSAKLPLLSVIVALDLDMLQQQNILFLKLQTFGDSGKKELTCYEYYSGPHNSPYSYYIAMQYHIFQSPKKVRNTAHSALILFLVNPQDSEVFKMVCIAIVARLDPTH